MGPLQVDQPALHKRSDFHLSILAKGGLAYNSGLVCVARCVGAFNRFASALHTAPYNFDSRRNFHTHRITIGADFTRPFKYRVQTVKFARKEWVGRAGAVVVAKPAL